jgi:hypothetical protein
MQILLLGMVTVVSREEGLKREHPGHTETIRHHAEAR